jgi:hypothetical protein
MDIQGVAQLLGNFGEFVGAVAVFLTLVYLSIQIRQNTHSMDESRRLSTVQAQQDWTSMFNYAMTEFATSEHLPRAWASYNADGVESLDDVDKIRLQMFMMAMAARLDSMHLQFEHGFLSGETYEATFRKAIAQYGPMWRDVGAGLAVRRASFVKEVESILAEQEQSQGHT